MACVIVASKDIQGTKCISRLYTGKEDVVQSFFVVSSGSCAYMIIHAHPLSTLDPVQLEILNFGNIIVC